MTGTHLSIICLCVISVVAQFEGDKCIERRTGSEGKCILLENCEFAKNLLISRQRPQHCGFKGFMPIVCCPVAKKSPPGERSKKQCSKYYPEDGFGIFVSGGEKASPREFPHMAILGYGDKDDIQWLCGGSLISEYFVLTAAHCVKSKQFGDVRLVRLGELDIKDTTDDAEPQDFGVISTFVHPRYKSPSHYHDIALLKLENEVKFTAFIRPACPFTGKNFSRQLVATGWGKVDYYGESSSHMMKVNLNPISHGVCARSYLNVSPNKLSNGIMDDYQLCAGGEGGKDTCPGDSGGPLQFKPQHPIHHFIVVGITSFGKACGIDSTVGVYTRVSTYIGWIENIVWSQE